MTAQWRTLAGFHTSPARLPIESRLPSFDGATGWLNSPQLACPLRGECPELALRNWAIGRFGVRGGTVPTERERLRAGRVSQLARVLPGNQPAGEVAS
jgi:hypothetical protein